MDKEVIPLINWETKMFSTPVLAVLVFASVAYFYYSPFTIFTFYVGGWDDIWLWLWISSDYVSGGCGHITSIFHWGG
ncbi:hypothetical protein LWI28_025848 [Acer negundo]|nr:hypothetical protein LWI28_025848 [Acer negundo]KAK4844865.1 hypothetical protein QYF36_025307 [Acer negundo]